MHGIYQDLSLLRHFYVYLHELFRVVHGGGSGLERAIVRNLSDKAERENIILLQVYYYVIKVKYINASFSAEIALHGRRLNRFTALVLRAE